MHEHLRSQRAAVLAALSFAYAISTGCNKKLKKGKRYGE
jgi:hypothetical protein